MSDYKNSLVSELNFYSQNFKIKRDDLLSNEFDGNKARKFYALFGLDFSVYDTIVSFGGAQSNAMYSLSAFAKIKNLKFDYYAKQIPSHLRLNPSGNYAHTLNNGANIIELSNSEYEIFASSCTPKPNEFFVPQGGAFEYAKVGLKILADELNDFCQAMKHPKVIISCGTGTSALYLSEYFNGEVFAVPCVGDANYLIEQFNFLAPDAKKPTILPPTQKYTFGKPHIDIYEIYTYLLDAGIQFDLLYDCIAWLCVQQNLHLFDNETIFIHSGGLRGNETMLMRYKRLGIN